MADWGKHLSDDELRKVREAFIELGLVRDNTLDALLLNLNPRYAAGLPSNPMPAMKLQMHLNSMNRVANLRNGDVPLAQYLKAAIDVSGDRTEVKVLEEALAHVDAFGPSHAGQSVLSGDRELPSANLEVQPEAMVDGIDDTLSIDYLRQAIEATQSVVRLLVHRHEGGEGVFLDDDETRKRLINGTGWFIGRRLVITNHHVINARMKSFVVEPNASPEDFRLQAENTQVMFDYFRKDEPSATLLTGPGALVASNEELDFAILRLPDSAPDRPPLQLRQRTIRKRIEQSLGTRVNLLQHPNGNPMRLGFRNNFVVLGTDDILSYLTDTAVGSSGSPVSDDRWNVAALHSGSQMISGPAIEIAGRRIRRENFGIPIQKILKKLETDFPAVHAEIVFAQGRNE